MQVKEHGPQARDDMGRILSSDGWQMSDVSPIRGAKILVTGASGNLGAEMARALAMDNRVLGTGHFERAEDWRYLEDGGVTPLRHALGLDPLDGLPGDIEYVFNFAAITPSGATKNGATVDATPEQVAAVNVQAVGEMMRRWPKLKGFQQASSSTVYLHEPRPLSESDAVGSTFGVYAATKYASEQIALFASRLYGIPTVVLRIFHSYGPRRGPVADRVRAVAEGRPVPLRSPGPNICNPLFTGDFTRLAIAAMRHAAVPPLVMNIGGEPVSQEDYIAEIGRQLAVTPKTVENVGANPSPQADLTLMKRLVGPPRVSIAEGIRRAIAFNYPGRA